MADSPFERHAVKQVIPRSALMIILQAASALNTEPEIVIFPNIKIDIEEEAIGPWICFNLDGRKFGVWVNTMALYEAEADGAMGTDILNPATLTKKSE
jgi:hypothetical protein